MVYQRLKKVLASLALSLLIISSGLIGNSVALAVTGHIGGQERDWRQDRRPARDEQLRLRREERLEMVRVRDQDQPTNSFGGESQEFYVVRQDELGTHD